MSEESDPPLLVPYVIDSSGRTEREFDIWSRLLRDRIVICSGEIEEEMATSICAQLLYLASEDPEAEVAIYVNGVGGSVTDGLAIIDTMRAIPCPVATYVVGCAPSMSSMIACCGTKGRRFATRNSWHMMHQGRIGGVIEGQATDLEIEVRHMLALEERCNLLYAEMTSKTLAQITEDCDRDRWLNADEMLEYGLIDSVIERVPLGKRSMKDSPADSPADSTTDS